MVDLAPHQVGLELHGRDIARADVEKAGEHMVALLEAVGEAMGAPGIRWKVIEPRLRCDGCGFEQPFEASRAGWAGVDGPDDYCPSCVIGGDR